MELITAYKLMLQKRKMKQKEEITNKIQQRLEDICEPLVNQSIGALTMNDFIELTNTIYGSLGIPPELL